MSQWFLSLDLYKTMSEVSISSQLLFFHFFKLTVAAEEHIFLAIRRFYEPVFTKH